MLGANVTIAGNITAKPELRFTQDGKSVCSLTVAHTERRRNPTSGEWEDFGDPLFLRVSVWRDQAENVAASLNKGDAVLVFGRLVSRSFKTKEGEDRTVTECEAEIISVDLRRQRVQTVARLRRDAAAADAPATAEPWSVPGDADAAQAVRRRADAA